MIRRLRPSYTLLEARNGEEAVELVRREHVDIAITDIRMPLKDGLAFLEDTADLRPPMKVVILSGYANFQYAQRALQLGSFDYMLKPTNDARVEDMLQKLEVCMEQEREEAARSAAALKRLNSALPVYLDHQLNQWVRGRLSSDGLQEMKALFGESPAGIVLVTDIIPSAEAMEALTPEDRQDLRMNLRYWIKAALDDQWHVLSFFDEANGERLVTLLTRKRDPAQQADPTQSLNQFHEELRSGYGLEAVTGVARWNGALFEGVETAYAQGLAACSWRFFLEEEHIIPYDPLRMSGNTTVFRRFTGEMALLEAIRRADRDSARSAMEELLSRLSVESAGTPDQLREEMRLLLLNAVKCVQGQQSDHEYAALVQQVKSIVEEVPLYSLLLVRVRGLLEEVLDATNAGHNMRELRNMQQCRDYLNAHYMEDLALSDVASRFGFNANYFGGMFKSQFGMTFTEYLLSVRMQHAQELLRRSAMKIYEIAERCGYRDVKYFIRVFKKIYGMAPDEFRKSEHSR